MTILVAGATGRVGHYLVEQLARAGQPVRALTRNPAKAKFSAGVEVVQGNLTQPSTLAGALEGVTGLHLITFDGDNYAPLETGAEIVDMAMKAGVKRVTVLTGGTNSPLEQVVQASSLAWTMLNPVEFMSGAMDYAPGICAEGVVRQPFSNRQTAAVHDADIASVAFTALTEEGHGGQSYVITGPEILTPRIMVSTLGKTIGRTIEFIELTPDEARVRWEAEGMPADFIDYMFMLYGSTPEVGYTVSPTIQQVTGHAARTFAQWAAEHADAFRA